MKNIIKYTLVFLFMAGLYSCQDVNEKFENLKEVSAPPNDEKLAITLTSDDYSTIADLALDNNANDTLNADTIKTYEFFTNTINASDYIPALLAERFYALGYQASCVVTYNFNGDYEYPLYQERFDDAWDWTLPDSVYCTISTEACEFKAFTPNYTPDDYLPAILRAYYGGEKVDYIFAEYNLSDGELVTFFKDDFPTDINQYTAINVVGTQVWVHDSYPPDNFAKMSGYDGTNDNENEDWLITPGILLPSASSNFNLEIVQAHAHVTLGAGETLRDRFNILISTDFDGANVATATWTNISDQITWPADDSFYEFTESGKISLEAYAGKTIFVAFKYNGTNADSPTWEINSINVYAGSAPVQTGDYYEQHADNSFTKVEGVTILSSDDYAAMGAPGKHNNFSEDETPEAYLPGYLTELFPAPYVGQIEKIGYAYYSGGTSYIVDEYIYNGSMTWEKYTPVVQQSDQFIVTSEGKWIFDPTILNKMSSADFQLIVDYVKENYGADYINSYGTAEKYHCADAYYENFDARKFDETVFETWQDAVDNALTVAFLPVKYPDLQTEVAGIEQIVIVEFDTYGEETGRGNYSWKYRVTEAGPNPKFERVLDE